MNHAEGQLQVKRQHYSEEDDPSQTVQNECTEGDNENTGDAQPLDQSTHGDRLSSEAATLLETLSDVAENHQNGDAADILLQEIHGYPHKVRNQIELAEFTRNLLSIRERIVPTLAVRKFSRDPRWSQQEWCDWIASSTFDRTQMNIATSIWRDELFPIDMSEATRRKEKEAKKGDRHDIKRSAFRAYQKEKYGSAALAKFFLKYPVTDASLMRDNWGNYIDTAEYKDQRRRHWPKDQRSSTDNARASNDNSANPSELAAWPPPASIPLWGRGSKHYEELANLRQIRKQALKREANAHIMEWFQSGGLDRRLERMTWEHGAGRYWDKGGNQIDLRPHAFEDYLERLAPS